MQSQRPGTFFLPRDRAFWIAASVLLVGQLIAFWTVCSQQVRTAQERQGTQQVERLAVTDCLRTVPGATLSSCSRHAAPQDSQLAGESQADETVPVNYVYQ
jgi:hypothetical protein